MIWIFFGICLVAMAVAEHSEQYSFACLILGAALVAWGARPR